MSEFNKPNKNADKKMDSNNNVVMLKNPNGFRRARMRLELNQKKVAITASIISISFIVALTNQQLLNNQNTSRTIASASLGDQSWQFDLAQKLANDTKRDIASVGTKPNEIDQLRFGFLEGKYSLRFEEGGLKEIQFSDKESGDRPKYIEDKEAFLNSNKNLFKVGYRQIKKAESRDVANQTDSSNVEVYDMIDEHNKIIAKAEFYTDTSGRLMTFKMASVSE